jgi:hypothetical protein
MDSAELVVKSHVARDLLQSAALFRHPDRVIWEYVANSLEYREPGVATEVQVNLQNAPSKKITISDNGRGMSSADLARFFTMHAENIDRSQGKVGRGMFGTGKSAAFAIANTLRITTVRDRKRCIVELRRSDLEEADSGAPVPLRKIEIDVAVTDKNGTKIEIENIVAAKIDRAEISKFLERNLRYFRAGAVFVNGQQVEAVPPAAASTKEIVADDRDYPGLGGTILRLSIAKIPLSEDDRGVAILSGDALHEVTLGSAKGKEMAQYIFGEVDVPALTIPIAGIAAYDMSRSGQLNPEHKLVRLVYAFVSKHVEEARKELVDSEKRRRAAAQAAKLNEQAREIARLINEDYADYRKRMPLQNTTAEGPHDKASRSAVASAGTEHLLKGGDLPAKEVAGEKVETPEPGTGTSARTNTSTEAKVESASVEEATTTGHIGTVKPSARRTPGGFDVQFRNNGEENRRAVYDRDSRTILINLDHPQLVAARGEADTSDINFRRLSFEVAFTEYSIGFAQELAANNEYLDFDEPLYDMRLRIDGLARKAAHLFADK